MEPGNPDRTKEVFAEAAELQGADRIAYLDSACSGDPEFRREVEELLAALDSGDDLLGRTSLGELLFGGVKEASIFTPGNLVGDRFRIVRLIGAGGMGEVYEAGDLRLGVRVAIKTLHSRYLSNPEFAARFRREIQLARRVTHKNVCRIFDFGGDRVGDKDVLFLTMELLEGETLAERLKAGALPFAEANSIARQIADGLAALHAAEVIHRDVKPSNVLLVGSGSGQRVVITDFGLAHHIAPGNPDETLSHSGQVLGTLAYASPEQLSGKKVGPSADIYALGLVMYEMLTGRRPFEGETAFDSAARKLNGKAAPPSKHVPVGPRWDGLILRCLELEPKDRISSAAELFKALEALQDESGDSGRLEALSAATRSFKGLRSLRKPAYWGLAAVLTTIVPLEFTVLGSPLRRRICERMQGSTLFCDLPPVKDIAVFPFAIEGTTESERALAAGWARYIRESFHRLALDPARMCVHLRNDRLSEGVRLVMEGATEAVGDALILRLSIRENGGPTGSKPVVLRRISVTSKLNSAEALQIDPLKAMARALGVRYRQDEWAAWIQGSAKHATTAVSHLTGLGYLAEGKFDQASREFDSAIDPTRDFAFPAAHVGLADSYRLLFSSTRDPAWELRARRAYERALPLDRDFGFGGAERGLADLDYSLGKFDDAIKHYSTALNFWPYDHPLQKNLVAAYESANRIADAEAVLRAAAQRSPRCWQPHNALGALLSRHARLQDAEKSFLELIRLSPDNGSAYHNLAFDYIKMGRYDDAIQMASKSIEVLPYPMAYSTLGRAYMYRGCSGDALINVRKSVELDPKYHILWSTLADVLEVAEKDGVESRAATERSITLSRDILAKTPGDTMTRARYALNLARIGNGNEAIREARRAIEQSPSNQHVLSAAAEALERAGKRDEALAIVEQALRSGLSVSEIEASIGLYPLRRDSRYSKLLARLQLNPAADPGGLTPKAGGCPAWDVPGKGLKPN